MFLFGCYSHPVLYRRNSLRNSALCSEFIIIASLILDASRGFLHNPPKRCNQSSSSSVSLLSKASSLSALTGGLKSSPFLKLSSSKPVTIQCHCPSISTDFRNAPLVKITVAMPYCLPLKEFSGKRRLTRQHLSFQAVQPPASRYLVRCLSARDSFPEPPILALSPMSLHLVTPVRSAFTPQPDALRGYVSVIRFQPFRAISTLAYSPQLSLDSFH
jgi:hypothetical protein